MNYDATVGNYCEPCPAECAICHYTKNAPNTPGDASCDMKLECVTEDQCGENHRNMGPNGVCRYFDDYDCNQYWQDCPPDTHG
jgi:hypothetical protein